MTEQQTASEWTRFVTASQPGYRLQALAGVAQEGEKVFNQVARELKLKSAWDVFAWAAR